MLAAGLLLVPAARSRVDSHYATARRLLLHYEVGRPETARNYENEVYRQIMGELEQVSPSSPSAGPARRLRSQLDSRIMRFKQAQAAREAARSKLRILHDRRQREFYQAQRRSKLLPVSSYPECEHETDPGE